jgi:glycosyltransferase involved in cell wall biosynthesis
MAGFLAERGATVGILTMRADLDRFPPPEGVEVIQLHGPLTSSLAYWGALPLWQNRIDDALAAWRPDVLIPQVFPANWWGWLHRRRHPRVGLIWVCHEPSAFIHSRPWINALVPFWKRWLARLLRPLLAAADIRLSRHTDRLVANSAHTAAMARTVYGRDADAIVYPGIDQTIFRPVSGEGRAGIITVARLTRFKRVDFLLRVFALVSASHPDLTFTIVGQGEDENALRALAAELGVGSRVLFPGSVDTGTLARLYRRSRLFLHGSVDEPFGMAPLEAIASGTPVVAHNSGGPMEIVDDTCGRLLDSLSMERWSEEIDAYLGMLQNNADYVAKVSDRASRFGWEKTLEPIVTVIQQLDTP